MWAKAVLYWTYILSGPVAQLGARFHGMEEVVGSIPTRSTNFNRLLDDARQVFNNHPPSQPPTVHFVSK